MPCFLLQNKREEGVGGEGGRGGRGGGGGGGGGGGRDIIFQKDLAWRRASNVRSRMEQLEVENGVKGSAVLIIKCCG